MHFCHMNETIRQLVYLPNSNLSLCAYCAKRATKDTCTMITENAYS